MAKQTKLYLSKAFRHQGTIFTSADSTNPKVIFTPGADDSKVTAIAVTVQDTVTNDLYLDLFDGTTAYLLGHINLNVNAGTNGSTVHANGLDPETLPALPKDGNGYLFIPVNNTWSLRAALRIAIGVSDAVNVIVFGEDY